MKQILIVVALLTVLAGPTIAFAQHDTEGPAKTTAVVGEQGNEEQTKTTADLQGLPHEDRAMVAAFVACAIAFITGVSVLGAAYAVAHVGSAAIGAASEKPEMMGRSLVFVALGEGLAVLGLAVAFLMMFTVLSKLV